MYNYLIDLTQNPKENIHISEKLALEVHKCILQSKMAFVKALYNNEEKWISLTSSLNEEKP